MKHTSLKSLLFLFVFVLTVLPVFADGQSYYCYSPDDIIQIRKSAQTSWGRKILDRIKTDIAERRSHDLTVPVVEGTRADRLHLDLMAAARAEVPAVFHRPVRLEGLDVPAPPAVPGIVLLVHA